MVIAVVCMLQYLTEFVYFLQWNRWKETRCFSSTFIPMQPQIRTVYMEAVQWSRERNGQRPNGFMWSHSTDLLCLRSNLGVWTRTRAARNGQKLGNARRIQLTWLVLKQTMDIAERAAKLALLKEPTSKIKKLFIKKNPNFCIAKKPGFRDSV